MGLPWARIDTIFPHHDKTIALIGDHGERGKAAICAYLCSILWSVGVGTDGKIPASALTAVHCTRRQADLLVQYELWRPVAGGYEIVNFLERQQGNGVSEEALVAMREGGRKGNEIRWGKRA